MNDKNGSPITVGDTVTFTGKVTKALEAEGAPTTIVVTDDQGNGHAFAPGAVTKEATALDLGASVRATGQAGQ